MADHLNGKVARLLALKNANLALIKVLIDTLWFKLLLISLCPAGRTIMSQAKPILTNVAITFITHNDDKNNDTVLHIFVKNRRSDTSLNVGQCDYITDHLAYQETQRPNFAGINPYLAVGEDLQHGVEFSNNSSITFDIPLRPQPVPMEEIVLPVVNIHILPANNDTWKFSFVIDFIFDYAPSFNWSSDFNGLTGIILDQDHLDYCCICTENPNLPGPPIYHPVTEAVLTQVKMVFSTHGDNKNDDTVLNIHIVNRLGPSSSQDIAIGNDVVHGQEFKDPSLNTVTFGEGGLPLASNSIGLSAIVLPQVFINIVGNDTWKFDYRVYYTFSNGQTFITETDGVVLDQDFHKHAGFYQGGSFPTVTPPGRPQLYPVPGGSGTQQISLAYLQKKLDDFINNRQGTGSQLPPIRIVRLHNTGSFGVLPESYYDVQAIEADPAAPGTLSPPGSNEPVRWDSSPTSLGQQRHTFGDFYFNNINSNKLTANVDGTSPTPITVEVDFDCSGTNQIVGGSSDSFSGMTLKSFSVIVKLTLTWDQTKHRVDLMSWIAEMNNWKVTTTPENLVVVAGQFLGKPISQIFDSVGAFQAFQSDLIGEVIDVRIVSTSALDPGGIIQQDARAQIYQTLAQPPPNAFDPTTLRDHLNSTANSWLVGGVLDSDTDAEGNPYTNGGCFVTGVGISGDTLTINYRGPQQTFSPPVPSNWPPPNFTPGTLANIDHIVVLTMENRSFDHILGYLSLPQAKGGMGRTDIDGLKGGEFNVANGITCPSFPFVATDTIITPDPPHGHEPVFRAINGGKMDGFAQNCADGNGPAVATRIMGYHTGVNVPVYDAMARDFGICHRWFAPHPGPTFCNRFYETTGRLNIDADGFWEFDNSSPLRAVFTPTIFDYLTQQKVSWKYFESYYCFLRFFEAHTFDTANIVSFDDPEFGFANLARTGGLPSVSFIDPHFIELPPDGNCDGPPADIQKGQDLVQQVVNAMVSSPLWPKTLLIVVYDEHGGFYDHVPPPAATPNSPESLATYGVRVPAFFVTPWIKPGSVFGHDGIVPLHFDHTSILKTIARRFMNANPPYLSARYATAEDLSSVLGNEMQTSQFLPFIPYNFVYSQSQKRLDVQWASTSPGTPLWQYDPNTTSAQQFSFEDAGGGFFYIRTHTGDLYLTAGANGVTQQLKYPTGSGAIAGQNPDTQRWSLTTTSVVVTQQNLLTIHNAAFPGMVLQPAGNSANSEALVVLAAPQQTHGIGATPNAWQVTSPLLPSSGQVLANA
jgi:phospholipase C